SRSKPSSLKNPRSFATSTSTKLKLNPCAVMYLPRTSSLPPLPFGAPGDCEQPLRNRVAPVAVTASVAAPPARNPRREIGRPPDFPVLCIVALLSLVSRTPDIFRKSRREQRVPASGTHCSTRAYPEVGTQIQ